MARRRGPSQRPETWRFNHSSPLANGLVFAGLGQCAGSTTYKDASVYNNDGDLTGYTGAGNLPQDRWGWSNYLKRPVLGFNGSSDYVSISNRYVSPQSAGTVMAFAYWNSFSGNQPLFDHRTDASHVFQLCALAAGNLHSGWYNGAETRIIATPASLGISAGSWFHVAVTWSVSLATTLLYVNGLQKGSPSGISTFSTASVSARIGNNGSADYMNGYASDIVALNRDLSASEIFDIANPSNVDLRIGATPLILPVRRYWGTGFNTGAALRLRYIASGGN